MNVIQLATFMVPAVLGAALLTHLGFFVCRRIARSRWADYDRRCDHPTLPPYACRQEFLDDLFGKASIADILEKCRGLAPSRPIQPPVPGARQYFAVQQLGSNGGGGGCGVAGIPRVFEGPGSFGSPDISGSVVFSTINNMLNGEFSKGLKEVVALKKVEPTCADCKPGDCLKCHTPGFRFDKDGPEGTCPECGSRKRKPEVAEPMEELIQDMMDKPFLKDVVKEEMIQYMMDEPFLKDVVKEWALHIEQGQDPATFANMYLEWMSDPERPEVGKVCSTFATLMKGRSWERMLAILEPKLPVEVLVQFRKPYAADFYDGWKAMVLEQIRAYWQGFLEDRLKRGQPEDGDSGSLAKV